MGFFGAIWADTSCCSGKAWHLFRAGARVTFFGAKKVTKETLKSNSNLRSEVKSGFFDEASCLIEKRRTSCAPPSGSTIRGKCAVSTKSSGRYPLSSSKQWFRCLHDLSCILHTFREVVRSLSTFKRSISSYPCLDNGLVGSGCRPGGRCTGCASFFDETGMSHRKIPAIWQIAVSNWT